MQQDAIGFGVYVDDLIAALKARGLLQNQTSPTILVYAAEWAEGFKVARELRRLGFEVEITKEVPSSNNAFVIDLNTKTIQTPQSNEKKTYTNMEDLTQKVGVIYGSN